GGSVETDPLLSKDIRFLFQPNSATLDQSNSENLRNLEAIKQLLTVSPGSTILLRGHVDNSMVEEFRKRGGEAFVRQMALKAVELSRDRAAEIQKLMVQKHGISAKRIEIVGRGWDEPGGPDPDQNRRVEVQWFTLE
ncbi:MAG: OmpA family protein, partial [Gemmatimonadetes bacterium]|nr:OmpA family protein [Gemmatimonadota bacterium]